MAHRKGGVDSQMSGGFPKPSMTGAAGRYDSAPAPFDHPHSMGGGGIPLKIMDTSVGTSAARKITPTQTAGLDSRAPRKGTVQRKFGTSDT